jgi:hypothetical protein
MPVEFAASLQSWSYVAPEGWLSFQWHLNQRGDGDPPLLSDQCSVRFTPPPPEIEESEIADIFLAILGPHLAAKSSRLALSLPFALEPRQIAFWTKYLAGIVPSCEASIAASLDPIPPPEIEEAAANGRLGLYFGGGVESLNLLSLLRHQHPYLLTVDGPRWMNSDYDVSSIKLELQRQLTRDHKVSFLRAWTDARLLFWDDDLHVNRYVSGTLMYYTLAPLLRRHGVTACLFGAELEYAQVDDVYDQSIHPRYIHRVVRPPNPPILPALTATPKIRLLADLYERAPEFLAYLYSCLRNTTQRWCGDCGKCRRLSRFCEVIGMPKDLIGMQEGIPTDPEDGELSRIYWDNCEKFRLRSH